MEFLIYFCIPCAGSIFVIGAMFYGAYRISGQSGISRHSFVMILVYTAVTVAFSLLGNTWVNLSTIFLFALAARWVFETPWIHCLYYLILSAAVFLTDVLMVMSIQMLTFTGILYLNSRELGYILLVAGTRMAEFMVIMLIVLVAGRKRGRQITARQVMISLLLPLYSIFNMYCMVYLMQIFPTGYSMLLLGVNLILLIGLNIYFCVLVDMMSENHRLENERNLYRTQARMQYQYYEQEEEKYEASRKMIHDIRNHIQAMEALYEEGNTQEAAGYAGDIHKMLNRFQQKYYTPEKLLNIILNDKARTMRQMGIREDFKVGELSLDFMQETDVTALFANLLDNAVTAAGESRDGYVKLRVNRVREFLSIIVENSCEQEPVKEAEIFRSRRAGHEGLGLKIIRQTVKQYGGDVQFDWKEGVFTVRVMLTAQAL